MGSSNEDLYELQWNNHAKILKGSFDIFRTDNELIDVTLSCEGKKLKAHKIVLSACSLYFLDLFRENPCKHPIVIMRDIKYQAMVDILNFMYNGEVNIATDDLQTFLKTAEYLQVKGLTEKLPKKINLPTNFVNNSETINTEKSVNDKIANLKRKCKKIIENIEISDSIIIDDNENDPLVKDSSENDAMEVTNEPENSNTDDEKNVSLSPKESEIKELESFTINYELNKEERKKVYSTTIPSSFYKKLSSPIPVISKIKNKRKKPIEVISIQRTEESTSQSVEENEDMDLLKTECVDLDDLSNDEIEYLGFDQNLSPEQNPEYEAQFSFMKELNGFASTSSIPRKSHPCPHCNKVFNHQISLKLHLPTHSGDTSCYVCHSVLGRKYDLKMHLRRIHNIEMPETRTYNKYMNRST